MVFYSWKHDDEDSIKVSNIEIESNNIIENTLTNSILESSAKSELLSDVYNFCHMYREHGGTVWAAPWCVLGHFGAHLFSGQYAQQGALNGTSLH